jgi:hypothetical protein
MIGDISSTDGPEIIKIEPLKWAHQPLIWDNRIHLRITINEILYFPNMRIAKIFLPLLFILLFSCTEFLKCGEDHDLQYDNGFVFNMLDKTTKKNLLYIRETNYSYDSVKILDSVFTKVYPVEERWTMLDGLCEIYFIDKYKDRDKINKRLKRSYYFYFNHIDIDTIDIEFEMKKNKCDWAEIKYFKVTYNDSTYFDGAIDHVPGNINFLK